MTAPIREEVVVNNATFSATITSPTITNDGRNVWTVLVKTGAVTTTPTLTVTVNVSIDGVNWVAAGTGPVISTATTQRLTFANTTTGASAFPPIVEPYIQVVVAFGSAGNFANTTVALIGL